jgi:hypothetical protein
MRGLLAGLAAAVALLMAAGRVAGAADATLEGAHWDARTVVVTDRTGDARVQAALEAFASAWNAMRAEPEFPPDTLPRLLVAAQDPARGCALPTLEEAAAAAGGSVLVCRDDRLASAGVGGPFWVGRDAHTLFALVKLRGSTFAWTPCNLRTAVAHEMGHVMGLGHNDAEPALSLMAPGAAPYNHGCPTWFSERDKQVLRGLYGHS